MESTVFNLLNKLFQVGRNARLTSTKSWLRILYRNIIMVGRYVLVLLPTFMFFASIYLPRCVGLQKRITLFATSVTTWGVFRKFLTTNFVIKAPQNFWTIMIDITFYLNTTMATFWATFITLGLLFIPTSGRPVS